MPYNITPNLFPSLFIVLALSIVLFTLANAIYQCFLSPLRVIPGPRSNAASFFSLWFWDVKGTSAVNIKRLHDDYGSIVRIAPNEISIDDHEAHNGVLYSSGTNFMKASYFYDQLTTGKVHTLFSTADRQEHSTLRRNVSSSFSKRNTLEYEPFIRQTLATLSGVLYKSCEAGSSFDLAKMTRCLALQYITRFAFNQNWDTVKTPGFNEPLLDAFDTFSSRSFVVLCQTSYHLELPLTAVEKSLATYANQGDEKAIEEDTNFTSVLEKMLTTMANMNTTYSKDSAIADGVGLIFAGTDTTSTTLTFALSEILSSPRVYQLLHEELKQAMPDPHDLAPLITLESLPYLTACVKEGLRISTPIRGRLPRVSPPGGWKYKGYALSAGTVVSSSAYLQNYRESVFPEPELFKPERWLCTDPAELKWLDQNLASFSKGSRMCTGIQLATAEIYMTLAAIIRQFKLKQKMFERIEHKDYFGMVITNAIDMVLDTADD
ncbi:cytochrome P450 [Phaeosphaeriaceae sp. PMI808]|nr:cytochrome P450 [Phaeosphaeriaceae sp. PMI808]